MGVEIGKTFFFFWRICSKFFDVVCLSLVSKDEFDKTDALLRPDGELSGRYRSAIKKIFKDYVSTGADLDCHLTLGIREFQTFISNLQTFDEDEWDDKKIKAHFMKWNETETE